MESPFLVRGYELYVLGEDDQDKKATRKHACVISSFVRASERSVVLLGTCREYAAER